MTNEDQVAALFAEANPVPSLDVLDPLEDLDIDPLEIRSKRSSVMTDLQTDRPKVQPPSRWPRLALLAAVPVFALAGLFFLGDGANNVPAASTSEAPLGAPAPLATAAPSTTATPSTTASPTDTTTWTTYRSERYGFSIRYPPDWIVGHADHDWTLVEDAPNWKSSGQEVFLAPNRDVRVSAWVVTLDPGTTLETSADVEEWIEEYCRLSEPSCTGFNDRAVPLCVEARGCHPGLLVPFDGDVQAFFPGFSGISWDRMVVVAIWRPDSDPLMAKYGGSQRLLEAFLSTMGVCRAEDRTLC